jgi:anti-anti-sigma regulatory factor
MSAIAPGWVLTVERGPDSLLVHVGRCGPNCSDTPPLADEIWLLMERHLAHRLVLELDEVDRLHSHLLGQLIALENRIRESGGLLRLSGVSPFNERILRAHGLAGQFSLYRNRTEAVMGGLGGFCPRQPR